MRLLLAAGAICAILAGGFFGVRAIVERDSGPDVAAFFAPQTPRACPSATSTLSVPDVKFAASYQGKPPAAGGKYLVVHVSLTDHVRAPGEGLSARFAVHDVEGHTYAPDPRSRIDWSAGAGAGDYRGVLAFPLPIDFSVGKLVFDDGCSHAEWVVP